MPPDDPLGRRGPTLSNFLSRKPKPPEPQHSPCAGWVTLGYRVQWKIPRGVGCCTLIRPVCAPGHFSPPRPAPNLTSLQQPRRPSRRNLQRERPRGAGTARTTPGLPTQGLSPGALSPCPPPLPGKKCTYGIKCKFYHPERPHHAQLAVADELRAQTLAWRGAGGEEAQRGSARAADGPAGSLAARPGWGRVGMKTPPGGLWGRCPRLPAPRRTRAPGRAPCFAAPSRPTTWTASWPCSPSSPTSPGSCSSSRDSKGPGRPWGSPEELVEATTCDVPVLPFHPTGLVAVVSLHLGWPTLWSPLSFKDGPSPGGGQLPRPLRCPRWHLVAFPDTGAAAGGPCSAE
eukprot:bmy_02556T0